MLSLRRTLAAVIATLLLAGSPAAQTAPTAVPSAAAAPDYGGMQRLCQPEDLGEHVFLMVDFHEDPPRRETHFFSHFKYSYLRFFRGNYYQNISANRPMTTQQRVEGTLGFSKGSSYILSKEGVLTLLKNDIATYSYRCIAILKARDEFLPGDLVMTGYTRKAKSTLYKLYRRWY